jgi:biotin carboxyl carrier protein
LEIENNERKIKIKRCAEIERIAEQKIQKITTEIPARVEEAIEKKPEELYVLKSFMTGRFYRSNKEGGEPLVKENDKVELDQPLGVIEIMKSLLDIKLKEYKDCSGKFEDFTGKYGIVRKIEVENGSDVQYGTPLFLIEAIKE